MLEIAGLSALNAKLRQVIRQFPRLRDRFLLQEAELVKGRAKEKTPVDTGYLRNSWGRSDPIGGAIEVYNNAEYAAHVEFGHRLYAWGKITNRIIAGKFMLRDAVQESAANFRIDAERMLERLMQ